MRARMAITRALAVALALIASACQTPPPPPDEFPEITFRDRPALVFNVAEVVVEPFAPAFPGLPDVSHLFPTPPAEAALRWARDRLTASGRAGRLTYEVREASALELPLEPGSGLARFFTAEQATRLDVRLLVRVRLRDDRGMTRSTVEVEAERSVTVPECAGLHERERTGIA